MFNSVGWFEGSAVVSVDVDVEDVIVEVQADKIDKFSGDLHTGEDCDQEVPIHPVVCFFLVAEGKDWGRGIWNRSIHQQLRCLLRRRP